MPERDDSYARHDLPSTTAEFRATPDASASTAQFKAFAAGQDQGSGRERPDGAWPEQPWAGQAPRQGGSRTTMITIAVILVLAIAVALLVAFG